jgi:hypothetical protein
MSEERRAMSDERRAKSEVTSAEINTHRELHEQPRPLEYPQGAHQPLEGIERGPSGRRGLRGRIQSTLLTVVVVIVVVA